MFLTAADVARIPGRRSLAFASITPLTVLPMKQNTRVLQERKDFADNVTYLFHFHATENVRIS
jgi:hypothetical protein